MAINIVHFKDDKRPTLYLSLCTSKCSGLGSLGVFYPFVLGFFTNPLFLMMPYHCLRIWDLISVKVVNKL